MNNLLRQSQRLQSVPMTPLEHSKIRIPYGHTTTMNFGELVPFYMSEVLPGSTFEISTSMLARMSTPLHPVMGNANIDYYYFFVPNRLVWDHWPNFCGENTEGSWAPSVSYEIPHMKVVPSLGSTYDHFGLPVVGARGVDINVLPLRAYRLIWNEWFRDENVMDPKLVNKGDTETDDSYRFLHKVCRYPDLFSTALPAPQKGQPVSFSLVDGLLPVVTSLTRRDVGEREPSLSFGTPGGQPFDDEGNPLSIALESNYGTTGVGQVRGYQPVDGSYYDKSYAYQLVPNNLYLDGDAIKSVTVNELREAFATQRVLEAFARCGTRYTEMLRGIFHTVSPDARLQRPEYLGGDRVRIEMQQVLQTSSTDETSPQGNTAAFSKTVTGGKNFTHTFTEHGIVIGVMCARVLHTYQQGLDKYWSKRDFFDFALPQLMHSGEQPIYNKEIYISGYEDIDNAVFGYQEYGYEYRFKPSHVTGLFRSGSSFSLDSWHYADYYTQTPILSAEWMAEGSQNVDRTLAVSSGLSDQLLIDIYQINDATLPMPVYSVPGLIDHF